ncbi:MAG: hypothetical protein UIC63_11980 [Bacteroidaceae bacterium]|nr:hypothetical protein [Bacteroidaceae bacterium]
MEKIQIQKGGMAYYDNCKFFMFCPDNAVPQSTEAYRYRGVAQQMSDGTFQFVPVRPAPSAQGSSRSWRTEDLPKHRKVWCA